MAKVKPQSRKSDKKTAGKKTAGKGSGVASAALCASAPKTTKVRNSEGLRLKIEAILANKERGRALYRRAGQDFDAVRSEMHAGDVVQTKYGAVTLVDNFAGRDSVVKDRVYFERFELQIVGKGR